MDNERLKQELVAQARRYLEDLERAMDRALVAESSMQAYRKKLWSVGLGNIARCLPQPGPVRGLLDRIMRRTKLGIEAIRREEHDTWEMPVPEFDDTDPR